MDDQPTTGSDPVDTGAENAQPVEQTTDPAAQSTAEPSTTTTTEPAAPTDDNLAWLATKGIDPSSPEAVSKLAEMYRNAERQMHDSTAKAASLEKTLQTPSPQPAPEDDLTSMLLEKVQSLELTSNVNNWLNAGGDAELAAERKALEPAMAAKIAEKPELGELVKSGYLSYDELAALTKGSDPTYGAKLKQDGGREALEQVASKQQARAVPGVATTSAVSEGVTRENFDSWYAGLSPSQRADPANQAIVSSLLS